MRYQNDQIEEDKIGEDNINAYKVLIEKSRRRISKRILKK